MIVSDLQPSSLVEDKGFRSLLRVMDPRYVLPSRRDIKRKLLPDMYNDVVKRLKQELRETPYVALTPDIWTSRQTRGLLTVTVHYITSDWCLKSAVLKTLLSRICSEWQVLDKVCTIVTDNGANMVAAVSKCMQKRLPCFAHTLNLVVQDSIKHSSEVKKVQEKIKRIVSFFHHSVKATDKLREVQETNGGQRKKLILDVETRWNSTYYMMERYMEQHQQMTTSLCLLGKTSMCLDTEDIDIVRSAVSFLEPFEEVTRERSGEKFTSVSKIIPITKGLQDFLKNQSMSGDNKLAQGQGASAGLRAELQIQMQRFHAIEKLFNVGAATLPNPRFMKVPFVDQSNVKVVEERLVNIMRTEYNLGSQPQSASDSIPPAAPDVLTSAPHKKSFVWKHFEEKVEKSMKASHTSLTGPHIEVRRYGTWRNHLFHGKWIH